MNPDLDAFVANLLAEHITALKAELTAHVERLVAAKPLPPFVPPPVWTEGRHGAGSVVRAMGGLFMARRDTTAQPLLDDDGSWLPLVVGLAGFDMRWVDDHKFVCMAHLSDGRIIETEREFAVPIVRGYWNQETTYMPGDRVFRSGEHHCIKMCLGSDPTKTEAAEHWQKVGGKHARDLAFALDEATGELTENGRTVGNVRTVFALAIADALDKRAA